MPLGTKKSTEIKDVLTTQGDILIRNATEPTRLGAGTSGQFLKTQGAGANPTWADVAGVVLDLKQGVTRILCANDTERAPDPASIVYTKLKEITLENWAKTKFTTYFELKGKSPGSNYYGRVYKNGVPFGTERIVTDTTYTAFTEDLDFSDGSTYEIWCKSTLTYLSVFVRNQRIIGEIKAGVITAGY